MAPIKIGVVGCARILPAHLRGLKEIQSRGFDDWRITALCARKLDDALMFRKRGEGPAPRPSVIKYAVNDQLNAPHMYISDLHEDVLPEVFTDWREMLRVGDVDAVLNLTTVGIHHLVTLDALRAGKHVLVEKPFAISVRAGQLMVDEARARNLSLGVAEVLRYREGVRHLRWAIDEGYIGPMQMWISGGMGSLDWGPDRIIAKTPWRHRKVEGGGGPAVDGAVHLFDQLRYVCGEIDEISAIAPRFEAKRYTKDDDGRVIDEVENNVEDAYFAHLRFANGAVGEVFGGVAGHGEPTGMKDGAALYGAKGVLKGGELVRDGGERANLADLFNREASAVVKERWFPRGVNDFFGLELLDWLQSIERGQPMETDGEEGLRDLACSYALLESATLNRPVKVADVLSGRADTYQQEINAHYGL
jgi:1,5-anhydro-D-fructose reductase (1,5-anhydro-D-mannitol-forming)